MPSIFKPHKIDHLRTALCFLFIRPKLKKKKGKNQNVMVSDIASGFLSSCWTSCCIVLGGKQLMNED